MSVISIADAVKEYSSGDRTLRALKGVSLSIDPGEFVAIVGPSGSGKSTLLNLLGLLDDPTTGQVTVDGARSSGLSTRERTALRRDTVGFVFQDFYLLPTLTARENVAVPGMLSDRERTLARADDLLGRVGLGDRLTHYPNELSGGQKQRVAIARSVIDVFRGFTDDDIAVVTVTHDTQVESVADRTVELVDGLLDPEDR